MLIAQSRQKSYADKQCRKLEFNIGDLVYLKVSPMKGVMRLARRQSYAQDPSALLK